MASTATRAMPRSSKLQGLQKHSEALWHAGQEGSHATKCSRLGRGILTWEFSKAAPLNVEGASKHQINVCTHPKKSQRGFKNYQIFKYIFCLAH